LTIPHVFLILARAHLMALIPPSWSINQEELASPLQKLVVVPHGEVFRLKDLVFADELFLLMSDCHLAVVGFYAMAFALLHHPLALLCELPIVRIGS
jgi:hypothetical protein